MSKQSFNFFLKIATNLWVMTNIVFNIRPASSSQIRALSNHCEKRTAEGWSAVDPTRSHFNQKLYGADTVSISLDNWYSRTGTKKPAKQAEAPYITIVMSAGSELFIDESVTAAFSEKCIDWLKSEFGDDLVHAELHLDETTPHLHAVIAPTYEKKKRTPGRKRKNETEGEFEERKAAAQAAPGIRTVGRSSSKWAYQNSFDDLRKGAVNSLADLGVVYGNVRRVGKKGQLTRDWVKTTAVKLAKRVKIFKRKWATLVERESLVMQKAEELKLGLADLRKGRSNLKKDAATIYQMQMESRSIHLRLADVARGIKKNLPAESLRSPAEKDRMRKLYEDLTAVLKDEESNLRSVNKTVDHTFEQTSKAGRGPRP